MVLRTLNAVTAGVLLAASGLFVWRLVAGLPSPAPFNMPLTDRGEPVGEASPELVVSLVTAFLLLSGLFQIGYVFVPRLPNGWRWLEYSLTATLMIIAIALVTQVEDVTTIAFMALAILCTMPLGYGVESCLPTTNIAQVWPATLSGWLLVLGSLSVAVRSYVEVKDDAPDFVLGIVIAMCLLFASFGVVQLVEIFGSQKGPTQGTEVAYVVLSLTAKTTLAALVASGFLFQTVEEQNPP